MNNIKFLVIIFILIETFVSIFIIKDLNKRIDTEIALKINNIMTKQEIIYNNMVNDALSKFQILCTSQTFFKDMETVNKIEDAGRENAIKQLHHRFLDVYVNFLPGSVNLIRIYDKKGKLIGRYVNGEIDTLSFTSDFYITYRASDNTRFTIDEKDIAVIIPYQLQYNNELYGYVEFGMTADSFLENIEKLYSSSYIFLIKNASLEQANIKPFSLNNIKWQDINKYKVMIGNHYFLSSVILKAIINNIDYVTSTRKDVKNLIRDIYVDNVRYWGVFIGIYDLNQNEFGYVAEIMPNDYIYQIKNIAFFLWFFITIALSLFTFIIVTMEKNKHSMLQLNNVLEGYKLAVDNSSQIIKFNSDLVIVDVNQKFLDLMGGIADEYIGETITYFSKRCSEPKKFINSFNLQNNDTIFNGIYEFRTKYSTKAILSVSSTPIVDKQENIMDIICVMKDLSPEYSAIGELKKAEDKSEEFITILTDYINATGSTVVVYQKDFTLEYTNSVFLADSSDNVAHCYKYDVGKCIKHCKDCYIKQVFKEKIEFSYEVIEEENNIYERISFFPILDKIGNVRFVVCEHGNIFDRVEYQKTLIDANNKEHSMVIQLQEMVHARDEAIIVAEQASKAKSLFLANMSHEIRTPINGIMGFLTLLKDCKMDKTAKEYINIISTSSENLLGVINNILDFSKIESGKMDLEKAPFNIISDVESVVDMYLAKAEEKQIELTLYTDPYIPNKMLGDSTKVKQVMSNLLSNAIKFTSEKGTISVDVRCIYKESGVARIQLSVTDNGIGMNSDTKEKIFSPFAQGDSSITRRFGGTGLGLSISNSMLEIMNSKLELATKEDKGSSFSFELSLQIQEDIDKNHHAKISATNSKILLFDNYGVHSKVLKEYMSALNVNISNCHGDITKITEDADYVIMDAGRNIKQFKEAFSKMPYKDKAKYIIGVHSKDKNELDNMDNVSYVVLKPINLSKIYNVFAYFSDKYSHTNKKQSATKSKAESNILKETKKEKNSSLNSVQKNKILVVEDNPVNQKLMIIFLQKAGFEVDVAGNGQESVDILSEGKIYDIIFMDIHMPIMDGVTATKKIRALGIKTPIIALTANIIKEDIDNFIASGMNYHLAKPINFDKLKEVIAQYSKNSD